MPQSVGVVEGVSSDASRSITDSTCGNTPVSHELCYPTGRGNQAIGLEKRESGKLGKIFNSTDSGMKSGTPSSSVSIGVPNTNQVGCATSGGTSARLADPEFVQFIVQAHELIKASGVPNYKGCKIRIPSKFQVGYLENQLSDYEDKEVVEFLKFGFPIGRDRQVVGGIPVPNHRSVLDYPDHMDTYVDTEVSDKAIIGGFSENPFSSPPFFSPIGSTEKANSEDRRIIMDLSFPRGRSINDSIPKDSYLGQNIILTFPRIDELVELVRLKGQGCLLFKKDLRRAYRQIRIDVGEANLLGFTWRGNMFFDISLPMGLRSSALCCQRTTLCIQENGS